MFDLLRNTLTDVLAPSIEASSALVSAALITQILLTLLVIGIMFAARAIVTRVLFRNIEDVNSRFKWQKTANYIIYTLGFLMVGSIWSRAFGSLATVVGLASAGVVVALSSPLTNLAAWIYILVKRPFDVGDRIELADVRGDVIDRGVFQIVLLEIGEWVDADQSTGRILFIPNQQIFSENLVNYSSGIGYIWNEIKVKITFESNWREAKRILRQIADKVDDPYIDTALDGLDEVTKRYPIRYSSLSPIVYTSVIDTGILLTVRYLCGPRMKRGTQQAIWEEALDRFAERDDIMFAYPTQRFYMPERGDANRVPPQFLYREGVNGKADQPEHMSQGMD